MIAFITFKSSLVPLLEGLWSSNSWEFEVSGFRRNRTDDLGHWLVLVTFVGLLVIPFAVKLSPFPLSIPSPTTLGPNIPCVLSPSWRPLGGDSPKRTWARGGKTYDWRAAAPLRAHHYRGCAMVRQDLTPGLAPSQHPCMQLHFTPTSFLPTPCTP